ncbi:MAG: hypothetical protein ACREGA_00715 [Candidatus Saccharimonadales bacterium]
MAIIKKHYLTIGLYLIGGLMLLVTNPSKLPIVLLLLPFLIFFLALMLTIRWLMEYFGGEKAGLNHRSSVIAALAAAFPILLLILQSSDKLSAADLVTVIILFVVLWFYVVRLSAK